MKVKELILNLRTDVHSLYTGYTRLPEKTENPGLQGRQTGLKAHS